LEIRGESADTHAGDDSNGIGEGDTADDDTRFILVVAHSRAANCSIAPGRPKPSVSLADITLIAFLFAIVQQNCSGWGAGDKAFSSVSEPSSNTSDGVQRPAAPLPDHRTIAAN
jgi:hypothetical protein